MVKATELRIGNWVYAQSRKLAKGMHEAVQVRVVTTQWQNNWWPIPLTEQWLKRMGFNTLPEKRFYIFHKERVLFEYWLLDGSIVVEGGFLPSKNHYVHQLQNLYFALIGEELKINEQ